MSKRALHCVVLNAVLVTVSSFYVFSPTIFAYVSEVSMTYSHVPTWFAATAPARMTASLFGGYNATAPRAARFRRRLSCFLTDDGATRNRDCTHELRNGQSVSGPQNLKITSGLYSAHFDFSKNDLCSAGEARLQVIAVGRFGRVLADYGGRIEPGKSIELPFRLGLMDAALAAVEFRAIGVSDCVLLTAVTWTRMPEGS